MPNEASKPVRVRFAPAPTGPLHLGGARTAILNWLFARRHGGEFILRIENTDAVRSSAEWERAILDDLSWLGVTWDEGPDTGGPYGPYRQTERAEHYLVALERLKAAGRVYPCFCSRERLDAMRRQQVARGEPPRYDGTCRNLEAEDRAVRLQSGARHTWRFAMGTGQFVVHDLIRGEVRFDLADLGDFIVARSDGSFFYLFASAVDDGEMRITHVLRGEDGLSNTPRQGALLEALGYTIPRYAHLPLLLDPEGKKLSKREASFIVASLRDRHIPPEALFQFLASLGYAPAAGGTVTREQLVAEFDVTKISKSPAKVDLKSLEELSGRLLRDLPESEFVAEARERLANTGMTFPDGAEVDHALAEAFQSQVHDWNDLEQAAHELLEGWQNLSTGARDILEAPESGDVLAALVAANEDVEERWSGEQVLAALKKSGLKVKGRALYAPIRVALTGRTDGPELKHVVTLLGRERLRERLARALAGLRASD